jgi:hypothetical protein
VLYVHVGIPVYLGNPKESEVADTRGSTATGAPPKKIRNVLCAFLCVPSHKTGTRDGTKQKESERSVAE